MSMWLPEKLDLFQFEMRMIVEFKMGLLKFEIIQRYQIYLESECSQFEFDELENFNENLLHLQSFITFFTHKSAL